MRDRYGYPGYRVLMHAKGRVIGRRVAFSSFPVWGIEAKVGVWYEFDAATLRGLKGNEKWRRELDDLLARDYLTVQGVTSKGTREAVSKPGSKAQEPPSGRKTGSGLNTLIRHLHVEAHVEDYDELVRIVLAHGPASARRAVRKWLPEGATSVTAQQMEELVRRARIANSSGKAAHQKHCPYCDAGLPRQLDEALTTKKRR